jgi:hypothetical protein
MSTRPAPDVDAAIVLGMASTAMPFARSSEDEAERWLRILRMYGEAGVALQSLGVSEAPLEGGASSAQEPSLASASEHEDVVGKVSEGAVRVAADRGSHSVGAADVLVAVMGVYGEDFDRVLRVHGTDRDEVLERLGMRPPEHSAG